MKIWRIGSSGDRIPSGRCLSVAIWLKRGWDLEVCLELQAHPLELNYTFSCYTWGCRKRWL